MSKEPERVNIVETEEVDLVGLPNFYVGRMENSDKLFVAYKHEDGLSFCFTGPEKEALIERTVKILRGETKSFAKDMKEWNLEQGYVKENE